METTGAIKKKQKNLKISAPCKSVMKRFRTYVYIFLVME